MNFPLRISVIVASLLLLLVIIYFGYIAATASESARKGKARFIATLVFGFWFCAIGLSMFVYNETRPVFEFTGVIESVQVIRGSSRNYLAYLSIATTQGGSISVSASDRSAYFRPGEHLWLRYRGDTGELVKATFYSANGNQEGAFRSTLIFAEVGFLLMGLFVIWAAPRRYRRDPEGAES